MTKITSVEEKEESTPPKVVQMLYVDGYTVKAITEHGIIILSDLKYTIYTTIKSGSSEDLYRIITGKQELSSYKYSKYRKELANTVLGKYDKEFKGYPNCTDLKESRYIPPAISSMGDSAVIKIAVDNNISFDNSSYTEVFYDIETCDRDPLYFGVPELSRPTSYICSVQIYIRNKK